MYQRVAEHRLRPSRLELDEVADVLANIRRDAVHEIGRVFGDPAPPTEETLERLARGLERNRRRRQPVGQRVQRREHSIQLVSTPRQLGRAAVDVVERQHDPVTVVRRPSQRGRRNMGRQGRRNACLSPVYIGRVRVE